MTIQGESIDLSSGTTVLMPPGSRVSAGQDPADRMRVFASHFEGGGGSRPVAARVPDIDLLERLCTDAVQSFDRSGAGRVRAESAVRLMLSMLIEAANLPDGVAADPAVAAVRLSVDQAPGRPWTLATMASRAGLSPPQFVRRFRRLAGRSPVRYVIEARTERAKLLLRESRMSLAEIADALGYPDVYYFGRQFRAETGMPPGRFRTG